jgi:hypothetical protein
MWEPMDRSLSVGVDLRTARALNRGPNARTMGK